MNRVNWIKSALLSVLLAGPVYGQAISTLPQAAVPLNDEPVPLVQSGQTRQVPAAAFSIPKQRTTAPTPLSRYQEWWDTSTSPPTLKVYDGTQWVPVGTLDNTGHVWTSLNGIPLSSAPAHTYLGNNTGITGSPLYVQPRCGDLNDAGPGCNGTLGAGLQLNGSALQSTNGRVAQIDATTNQVLTNAFCGYHIRSNGAGTISLPASPLSNCGITIELTDDLVVLFNGQVGRFPGISAVDVSALKLAYMTENTYATFQYNGTRWVLTDHSPLLWEQVTPLDNPRLRHGQVVLAYDGSTYFTVCQRDGPGGLIVRNKMHAVPNACLKFNKANTTSSATNYFYVQEMAISATVSGAANNGSGLIRLTVSSSANVGDQIGLICHSVGGVPNADGVFAGTVIDSTHVDLLGSTFAGTYTSGGGCRIDALVKSTSAPSYGSNGVMADPLTHNNAYVGQASIGASNAVNSTTSWFFGAESVSGAVASGASGFRQALCADIADAVANCNHLGASSQLSGSASITAPASTSVFTMAGLGASFTPSKTGTVLITIWGTIQDTSATGSGVGIAWQISHGTGTAPANGAALAGTQDGSVGKGESASVVSAANVNIPFSSTVVVSGLAVGTTYWIDLAQEALTTVSQYHFANVAVSAVEI